MAKRKTEFEMHTLMGFESKNRVRIVGIKDGKIKAEFWNEASNRNSYLQGKDLETFALNILKSLKSKHLKQ